jgi:plastocyanin
MKHIKLLLFTLLLTISLTSYAYADQIVNVKQDARTDPSCEDTMDCVDPFNTVITVGETVTWIGTPQNVNKPVHFIGGTPETGQADPVYPDTRNIIFGEPQEWTYEETGVFPYFSRDHPWITGSVTVMTDPNRPLTKVPNVINLPLINTARIFISEKVSFGTITNQNSDTIFLGNVISTTPVAGTVVNFNTPVNVVMSAGLANPTGSLEETAQQQEARMDGLDARITYLEAQHFIGPQAFSPVIVPKIQEFVSDMAVVVSSNSNVN